jgi:hypothetical protein
VIPGDTDRERRTIFLNGLDVGGGCAFAAFAARASFAPCERPPVLPPETPGHGYRDRNTTVRQELRLLMEHHLANGARPRKYSAY